MDCADSPLNSNIELGAVRGDSGLPAEKRALHTRHADYPPVGAGLHYELHGTLAAPRHATVLGRPVEQWLTTSAAPAGWASWA